MSKAKAVRVPALERALDILELISTSGPRLTLSHLSRRLRVPKSSVHYILLTLERRGYLHRDEVTNGFLFGLKILTLASAAMSGIELRRHAAPHLRRLAENTGLTVHLAVPERDEVVLVDKVEPPGLFRLATWVGKRMDLHCSGVGKAIMAYLPKEQLDRLIRHGFTRYNENTLVGRRRVEEEMVHIRKRGYALDDEEGEIGFRCVGCPVFDHEGQIVAAVSVAGTTSQITSEKETELTSLVKQTADSISRCLGFHR